MNDFNLYVDFDSTLFDTKQFSPDLFALISEWAQTSIEEVAASTDKYITNPGLGGYDYVSHVTSFGLDPVTMWQELDKLLANKNYLYADSSRFIQGTSQKGFQPKILSFGETRFQMAKIAPALPLLTNNNRPEAIVIDYRKHEYIRKNHAGQKGALIDDVANQDLPKGFTEIHLDRKAALATPEKTSSGYRVSNLQQAHKVLLQILGT